MFLLKGLINSLPLALTLNTNSNLLKQNLLCTESMCPAVVLAPRFAKRAARSTIVC